MKDAAVHVAGAILAAHPKAPRRVLMQRENISRRHAGTQVHAFKTKAIVAKKAILGASPKKPRASLKKNVYIEIAEALGLAVLLKRVALRQTQRC